MLKLKWKGSSCQRPKTAKWFQSFRVKTPTDTDDPWISDLTCNEQGDQFLIDSDNKKLKHYSESHELTAETTLPEPTAVCSIGNGKTIVSSADGCWVIPSRPGAVHKFAQGDMVFPVSVTCNERGHVFVCDEVKKLVCVYDFETARLVDRISIAVCKTPKHIAIQGLHDGILAVTDHGGHCVYGVTPQGDTIFKYGVSNVAGCGDGQLNSPWGICSNAFGEILVADWLNSRVAVLGPDWLLRSHVPEKCHLSLPTAITMNQNGQLIIADRMSRRLACAARCQIFEYC